MAGPTPLTSAAIAPRPNILRCIIVIVIAILLIIGLIILIIWLVIRPAPITYTVTGARISNYNLTTTNGLNGTFDITILTENHNKKISVHYDYIEASVWYAEQMVAVKELSPFDQRRRNATTLAVRMEAKEAALTGSAAKSLKRERSAGVSSWEVRVEARVRFRVGSLKSRHYEMKVDCQPVVVHFPSGMFKSVSCDVDI